VSIKELAFLDGLVNQSTLKSFQKALIERKKSIPPINPLSLCTCKEVTSKLTSCSFTLRAVHKRRPHKIEKYDPSPFARKMSKIDNPSLLDLIADFFYGQPIIHFRLDAKQEISEYPTYLSFVRLEASPQTPTVWPLTSDRCVCYLLRIQVVRIRACLFFKQNNILSTIESNKKIAPPKFALAPPPPSLQNFRLATSLLQSKACLFFISGAFCLHGILLLGI